MSSSDYEEILASVQDVVQRAYALGRAEALKRVIEVMKGDEQPAKPLALMAPSEATPHDAAPRSAASSHAEAAEPITPGTSSDSGAEPSAGGDTAPAWWARPPRIVGQPSRRTGSGRG